MGLGSRCCFGLFLLGLVSAPLNAEAITYVEAPLQAYVVIDPPGPSNTCTSALVGGNALPSGDSVGASVSTPTVGCPSHAYSATGAASISALAPLGFSMAGNTTAASDGGGYDGVSSWVGSAEVQTLVRFALAETTTLQIDSSLTSGGDTGNAGSLFSIALYPQGGTTNLLALAGLTGAGSVALTLDPAIYYITASMSSFVGGTLPPSPSNSSLGYVIAVAVPEPGTLALLATGLVFLSVRSRRI